MRKFKKDLSFKASIESSVMETPEAFRQPAIFRINKKGKPATVRFVQHGKKLKRIKIETQRVLMTTLSQGFVMMAARYAAARGWKTVTIVQNEYNGYQMENELTFVNLDQLKNVRCYNSWTHVRPVYELEAVRHYLPY